MWRGGNGICELDTIKLFYLTPQGEAGTLHTRVLVRGEVCIHVKMTQKVVFSQSVIISFAWKVLPIVLHHRHDRYFLSIDDK